MAPAEVAAAVRDLLVAARMPLDLDREKLIQDTLALREELKAAQSVAMAANTVRLNLEHACLSLSPGSLKRVQACTL